MTEPDTITDVVELCALLQCVGFTVKSLDTSETNLSQDGAAAPKTVVINCQSSGIHVVLESPALSCSCPVAEQQTSGFWQVSGVTGGKLVDKESGSTLLRALPKQYRERLSKQLVDMIRCIRALNDLDAAPRPINKSASLVELASKSASVVDLANKSTSLVELSKGDNKSASMLENVTPENKLLHPKIETPTRYRSLDTLTKDGQPLMNPPIGSNPELKRKIRRQSTYTVNIHTETTPASVRRRNKTSSPIQAPSNNLLDSLIEAERVAENLRNKLALVIKDFVEDEKHDTSISMLDVSKISVLKGPESKTQFMSSPNLSGLRSVREDCKSTLKKFGSASTSNLAAAKSTPEGFKSKLKRISPNIFKMKKDISAVKDKSDGTSKFQSLLKPRILTPVLPRKIESQASPIIIKSATKKKFSHIKSTLPRPTPKK